MQLGTLVVFKVQNAPVESYNDIYIMIRGDKKTIEQKMQKNNQCFTSNIFVKKQTCYRYKYKIYYQKQNVTQEKGFRNFIYQQNIRNDVWNSKEVIIRIQTAKQEIMKTIQIFAYQKQDQKNIIKKVNLDPKKVIQQNQIYYEGNIFADCAMDLLELEFTFNAMKYDTNRNEQKYTIKKNYCYSDLKTIGNQSFIEIQDEQFDQMSNKTIIPKNTKNKNNQKNQSNISNPYFSLSNDNVENLRQLYDSTLKYFQECLEKKDQQIKQLEMEKLEDEDKIFYQIQDNQSQDIFSEYQNQFNQIVQDFQTQSKSFLIQFKEQQQEKQLSIKEYKEKISNKSKTIEGLLEKVNQLKQNNQQNEQKIQQFEDKILKYQELLKKRQKIVDQLEEELNKVKKQNQMITQEKEKFQNQIVNLDNEIREFQRTKETLEEKNQIVIQQNEQIKEEKEKVVKEKQEIFNKLFFQENDFEKRIQNYHKQSIYQRMRQNELKAAKQLLGEYKNSSEIQINKMKESKNILINLILNYIKDLKDIISYHKELDIKVDVENIKTQLNQMESNLKNYQEEKIILEQIDNDFQSQVQKQLEFLFKTDRIKKNEQSKIKDIQNILNQIFLVLQKFDQIKDKMPKLQTSQIFLQHQQSEINIQNIISPRTIKIGLRRMGTCK